MEPGFIFSSKPKQISNSAKGIAERIFGNLSNLSFCSIGNDEIINSISKVFEKNKLFKVEINEKILKNFEKTFYSKKNGNITFHRYSNNVYRPKGESY